MGVDRMISFTVASSARSSTENDPTANLHAQMMVSDRLRPFKIDPKHALVCPIIFAGVKRPMTLRSSHLVDHALTISLEVKVVNCWIKLYWQGI